MATAKIIEFIAMATQTPRRQRRSRDARGGRLQGWPEQVPEPLDAGDEAAKVEARAHEEVDASERRVDHDAATAGLPREELFDEPDAGRRSAGPARRA